MSISTTKNSNRQYVITRASRENQVSVAELLRHYAQVDILDEIDSCTVLVTMAKEVQEQISRDHPELIIEPNVFYKLQE